jgi:hypothetical protein
MALGDFGVAALATLLHLREVGVGPAIQALPACPQHGEWTLVKLRVMRNFRTYCDCEKWDTLFATLACTRAKMLLEDFRACQTVEALAATFAAGAGHADAHEKREVNCVFQTVEKALRPCINAVVVTDSMGEFVRRCRDDDDGWKRAVDVLSAFASLAKVHGRRMVNDWVHMPQQIQGQCPS